VLVLVLIFGFWYGPRLFRRSAHEDEPEILPVTPNEAQQISSTVESDPLEKSNGKISTTADRKLLYGLPNQVGDEMHRPANQKDPFAVAVPLASGQQKNEFCCETAIPSNLEGVKALA